MAGHFAWNFVGTAIISFNEITLWESVGVRINEEVVVAVVHHAVFIYDC